MATWISNSMKFNTNMKFQSASDEDIKKREERIEAEYQAQQSKFRAAEASDAADDDERKKALGLK